MKGSRFYWAVSDVLSGPPKIGVENHPKWVMKIMENPMNKWDGLGVFPYFWKHPFVFVLKHCSCVDSHISEIFLMLFLGDGCRDDN